MQSIKRLLIANRGEIACRIIRTAKKLGIVTISIYSDADANALHVKEADEAYRIGPSEASKSYLRADTIISIAKEAKADAIHPGYGFLSENAEFAGRCKEAGIIFVGPPAEAIRSMGLKGAAKALMLEANVPVVPGYHEDDQDEAILKAAADKIGYPVLIKAVAGGGGKGMRKVDNASAFMDALQSAKREAQNAFSNDKVLIEKYIETPRHIEIQVFADQHGKAVHLFERDCSLQRRHQKVVEEAPAPHMSTAMREKMGDAAVRAAKAIGYVGAGTIEFIVDASNGLADDGFYFMEMNTRLQVEHPITEMITGTDLVEWQLKIAAGEKLPKKQSELTIEGHAIEVRLYAEDPKKEFLPQTGTLKRLSFPHGDAMRIETGVAEGDEISVYYDPMIAKLVAYGADRDMALNTLICAIKETGIAGLKTNLSFLRNVLEHTEFQAGNVNTHFIDKYEDALLKPIDKKTMARVALSYALWNYQDYARKQTAKSDKNSPWNSTYGWRTNQEPEDKLSIQIEDGDTIQVKIRSENNRYEIHLGDECFTFDLITYDNDYLQFAGTENVRVYAEMNTLICMTDGHSITVSPALGALGQDAAGEGEQVVNAPMPGKIIDVSIKIGDHVKKGQNLIVMEAMKMEYTLTAEVDGTIQMLNANVGEQVVDGALLAKVVAAEH